MMIRISGNIWLTRIQPSPNFEIQPARAREDVRRRQADERRQDRGDHGDLEAVQAGVDELGVVQRRA